MYNLSTALATVSEAVNIYYTGDSKDGLTKMNPLTRKKTIIIASPVCSYTLYVACHEIAHIQLGHFEHHQEYCAMLANKSIQWRSERTQMEWEAVFEGIRLMLNYRPFVPRDYQKIGYGIQTYSKLSDAIINRIFNYFVCSAYNTEKTMARFNLRHMINGPYYGVENI